MQRQADILDVYSRPGKGTALFVRIYANDQPVVNSRIEIGAVCIPIAGETECGDGWAIKINANATSAAVLVVDGLGHGEFAALAAKAAIDTLEKSQAFNPERLMNAFHAALRPTRGAALAIAELNLETGAVEFAGVGNIAAGISSGGARKQLISHNGIVGHNMRKVQQVSLPCPDQGLFILHSDGIQTQWDIEQYPGLSMRHPALIAGVIYRDFCRGRDDVTVFVLRYHAATEALH